jgi:hypothetical protein
MYNRFNLGRHLVSAKIIDIFDCEPLAWLWRGFGVALARLCVLGKGSGNLKII